MVNAAVVKTRAEQTLRLMPFLAILGYVFSLLRLPYYSNIPGLRIRMLYFHTRVKHS